MRFVNDIYEMYRNHLTGDEEDAVALVLHLLQEHSKKDILNKVKEMEEDEIFQMFAMYVIELLKVKINEEGVGSSDFKERPSSTRYH